MQHVLNSAVAMCHHMYTEIIFIHSHYELVNHQLFLGVALHESPCHISKTQKCLNEGVIIFILAPTSGPKLGLGRDRQFPGLKVFEKQSLQLLPTPWLERRPLTTSQRGATQVSSCRSACLSLLPLVKSRSVPPCSRRRSLACHSLLLSPWKCCILARWTIA